jgi:hypothetical protein
VATPGASNLVAKVLSEDAGRAAVETILDEAREDVRRLLGGHRHLVEALRDALLEREELIGEEIGAALDAAARAHDAPVVDLRTLTDQGVPPVSR